MRPPRPTGQRQKQWLQDPVWNASEAGWGHKPERRCRLSVMHHVFLASSITMESVHSEHPNEEESPFERSEEERTSLEQPDTKEELSVGTGSYQGTPNQVPGTETWRRRRGKIIPRIASFFQFLRDSESQIERRVNEMDKVDLLFSTPPLVLGLMWVVAPRRSLYFGSGTTEVIQSALQDMQPASYYPKVNAHPRLFERRCGS